MYGETSAYIVGSSLFADIKNPQTKYIYKSVAPQKYIHFSIYQMICMKFDYLCSRN